jgi:hypothetical protein
MHARHQKDPTEINPFDRNFLNPSAPFMTIGSGKIGGKASGLSAIRPKLFEAFESGEYQGIQIDIPSLVVMRTGVFDRFIEENDLLSVVEDDLSDERIAHAFLNAELPFEVLGDLRAIADQVLTPLAVRSSSLLEDARHEPFAGVYATKMIPNNRSDPDDRFRQMAKAIKFVYASTFTLSAKNYRKATGHAENEEKMAVIIQELVGKRHHTRFYPELSGVARSVNYYPMGGLKPEEGVVSLALGLGKAIVDGQNCWFYAPTRPNAGPPFGSVEDMLNSTQINFWSVNMGEVTRFDPGSETEFLLLGDLKTAENDGVLRYLSSTYSPLSNRLNAGLGFDGPRVLTFAPILVLKEIPLNELISRLLEICEEALNTPVEIEFAMTFNPHRFRFLQVRTMESMHTASELSEEDLSSKQIIVESDQAFGQGSLNNIHDVVYSKPENFDLKHTSRMVPELEYLNKKLLEEGRPYLLVVLGRLGTTDPWLGIPIDWGRISGAQAVVEATSPNVRVELSQGSHYFHNVISLGVKYFNLPLNSERPVDWAWLKKQETVEETEYFRHVYTPNPLLIHVNGRTSRGSILASEDMSK